MRIEEISVESLLKEASIAADFELQGSKDKAKELLAQAFSLEPQNYEVLSAYATVLLKTDTYDYPLLNKLEELISNCSEEQRSDLLEVFKNSLGDASIKRIKSACSKYENADHFAIGVESRLLLKQVQAFQQIEKTFFHHFDIDASPIKNEIVQIIYAATRTLWNGIYGDYKHAGRFPNKYDFQEFIDDGTEAIATLNDVVNILCVDDIDIYEFLCVSLTTLMISCSWELRRENGRDVPYMDTSLTDSAINVNINKIKEYLKTIGKMNSRSKNSVMTKVYLTLPQVIAAREFQAGRSKIIVQMLLKRKFGYDTKKSREIIDEVLNKTNSFPPHTTIGGCYIATAVYGSYDCPQVWVLRRFRDYTLAETWYGRSFIHCYYAISPVLVNWFGQTAWFKKIWKKKLDRIVDKLITAGIENTPYKDRRW